MNRRIPAPGTGIVDSLCLGFLPDRRTAWEEAVSGQGLSLKVRADPTDSFADGAGMVSRMDELGIGTVVLVASDVHPHPTAYQVSSVTLRFDEVQGLVRDFPGRFAALWSIEPQLGSAGLDRLDAILSEPWVVGAFLHTHSFDRPFDHADLYPFYAACRRSGVAMVMQAGASGGHMPSECGRPIGIDRPAIYFPDLKFVLSHTGWPWVDEALAMALKFPNVYISTASWPPRRWSPALVEFLGSPVGAGKVLFATNFPTVGHRQALAQLASLGIDDQVRDGLLGDNARSVFCRLPIPTQEEVTT